MPVHSTALPRKVAEYSACACIVRGNMLVLVALTLFSYKVKKETTVISRDIAHLRSIANQMKARGGPTSGVP